MSARETILAAIAAALSGVAGGHVYRSRREQLDALPAVVIEPAAESASEIVLGYMDRRLQVAIHVFAKGDTPDGAADATLSSVWYALYANPSLGLGSDVQIDPTHELEWDFEDYDHVRATLRITLNYRTQTGGM